jgi:microcystin-dependent protein
MPVLSTGKTFAATEQITSTKLNNIANGADFTDTSGNAVNSASTTGTCVNGGGLEVTSGGQLQVKDDDIDFVKLSDDAALTGGRFGIMNIVYPVGSVFIGVVSTNPDTLLFGGTGLTTWAAFGAGKVLVGIDSSDTDFDAVEETGGAKTKALEFANMPAHSHQWYNIGGSTSQSIDATTNTSSQSWNASGSLVDITDPLTSNFYTNTATDRSANGSAFSIVQPYIVVYMWKRTA